MLPLLLAFMLDVVQPLGVLARHIECLALLEKITSFLTCTIAVTDAKRLELDKLLREHMAIFVELYRVHVKIKFHHTGHLARDLWRMGSTLSCFPLERKHRDLKEIILYVFRSVELTSAKDFVNHAVQNLIEGRFRLEEYWLENDVDVNVRGHDFNVSWHAHTPIGEIRRDDVVVAREGDDVFVGAVNRFFERGGDITVDINQFENDRPRVWTDWITDSPQRAFFHISSIVSVVAWARRDGRRIRVLLPSAIQWP